ncbi:SDR family oxidoreductase [Oceanicoccus sp. KOV_DT_Chl]|uniref:SDR family oxidoreductase n=1 Tax=Oceanicoccus sp. KOV_DT_Chl TaxID=1904639 RepID=UPI000C7CE91E|nr:SDR family oxidoreductase [Oceanicoccus sp. KOV_DT_Chl]
MTRFNRWSTAEKVSEGVDLTGKNALVTGANTGLGLETARVLALRGANVILACRNQEKAELARANIINKGQGAIRPEQLDILLLDLNSLARVKDAANAFLSWDRPLHLLINNAGIMIPMERRTEDGFEAHLGINHLGHFLFFNLIVDALIAAKGARVVVVSSGAMAMATLTPELEDLNWQQRKFSGMRSYGDSKLMNLLFAKELTKRFSTEGIVANAVHPGVVATELARDQSLGFMLLGVLALPFAKNVKQGAATSVYVATAPDYADRGGLYFGNCSEWKPSYQLAQDENTASALWQRSGVLTAQ